MMAKLMRWRPWPPSLTKQFKVNLKVQSLEGVSVVDTSNRGQDVTMMMMIKVKWCGAKGPLGYPLGRSQKRAQTSEKGLQEGCIINWQEEFEHLCLFTSTNIHAGFTPFRVHFTVIQLGTKSKATVLGTASMNLSDLAPWTQAQNREHTERLDVMSIEGKQKQVATLSVTVSFSEDAPTRSPGSDCSPPCPWPSPLSCLSIRSQQIPMNCEAKHMEKKVPFVGKKITGEVEVFACPCMMSTPSEKSASDVEVASDNDSMACSEARVTDAENQLLQSYGSLTRVNLFVEGALSTLVETIPDPSGTSSMTYREAFTNEASTTEPDQSVHIRRLLSFNKRRKRGKLTDRGEPLLRKKHNDTGGDDLDDVREWSHTYANDQSQEGDHALHSLAAMSECLNDGEIQFSVGCWERKELVNRVGHMKLLTNVFFASIDQRSERAGGESACTALVVVIADWLHRNPNRMPIRADLDTLIRQGSAEWRTLCDNELYRKKFPDQHFDLDTVLEANIRPLGIVEGGTSVGFFKPEVENRMFDFLHGAVLFDDIWEASIIEEALLSKVGGTFEPAVYIVSWNDHFFLLKVDREAYYIIDTLGERLYEGCKQAYMLCFDKETILTHQLEADKILVGKKGSQGNPPPLQNCAKTGSSAAVQSSKPSTLTQQPNELPCSTHQQTPSNDIPSQEEASSDRKYTGRDACKEFIKGFFAALALNQLYKDIQKGVLGTSLHKRLQIEFHRTCHLSPPLLQQGTRST